MRNTTKLKQMLQKYSVCIDMTDDGIFVLNMVDKFQANEMHTIEAKSYSAALTKAYSFFLKELKRDLNEK